MGEASTWISSLGGVLVHFALPTCQCLEETTESVTSPTGGYRTTAPTQVWPQTSVTAITRQAPQQSWTPLRGVCLGTLWGQALWLIGSDRGHPAQTESP